MQRGFLNRVIVKGTLLILPFFMYYICYYEYLIITRQFSNDASTIYRSIDKSKKKTSKKKVIFGDSVGAQLYPNDKDSDQNFYSLTTSAPSSLAGIYILLQNFIANNDVNDVDFYYVVHPGSLDENLKGQYTYNHFVKPFYTYNNMNRFPKGVYDSVSYIPYWYASQVPFIKITDWQPQFSFKKPEDYRNRISPLYVLCFEKINFLSKVYHFRFHVVMPILREDYRNMMYEDIALDIKENHLEEMFSDYFTARKYLPVDQFHTNSNHYLHPYELGDNPLNL